MRGFLDETFDEGVEHGLQRGLQEGFQQGFQAAVATTQECLLDLLDVRFGGAPPSVVAHIRATQDVRALSAWHRVAATSDSIEDFATALGKTAE